MVSTRSQDREGTSTRKADTKEPRKPQVTPQKRKQGERTGSHSAGKAKQAKVKTDEKTEQSLNGGKNAVSDQEHASETKHQSNDDHAFISATTKKKKSAATKNPQIQKLMSGYADVPLSWTSLDPPITAKSAPSASTMLALLLNAMLSSARISHELAAKTVVKVIEVGYHDLSTLKKSSWQERTEVLTEGGYTRYREKTATGLGELVETLEGTFDSDLNSVLKRTKKPAEIRKELKQIKGLGDVGVDIFFDTAQCVWPCLAPFTDPRNLKTAKAIGAISDEKAGVHDLWEAVGNDPLEMCKLSEALTKVRLEGKETEFQ